MNDSGRFVRDSGAEKWKDEVKALKRGNRFTDARGVLENALKDLSYGSGDFLWAQQQLALCTYKDHQLRSEVKFRKALDILRGIGLFNPDTDEPETLGLGGAVFKRMWECDGNEAHLRSSLVLYRAGWERKKEKDQATAYCGVNAAYILDLLAYLSRRTARRTGMWENDSEAKAFRNSADRLRHEMLEKLPKPDFTHYWFLVTHAEIRFGLEEFGAATELLGKVRGLKPDPWEIQSTVTQLLNLARWRNMVAGSVLGAAFVDATVKSKGCKTALAALLGSEVDAAMEGFRGKVGLALSGGGFRAAFFHIGVLARLAEIDALRHVEVLSTVSGGSIIGTHYYLELKQLLESKPDRTIVRQDYITLIQRIQETFLKGVQRNLRMRVLSSLWGNIRMFVLGDYTRSKRIGELYEQEIYSRVVDGTPSCKPRPVPSLFVAPADFPTSKNFKPKEQNWLRFAKVPELVINSTSLNSGHNFQFTASWMGEPPGLTGAEVDMNIRHRRLYYHEAPTEETRNFRLGFAVAASSCVPGLFEPLVIKGLYPGRTVKLVDGGVHDNQGTCGLLDEGCDFILCSDASGHMHDEVNPSTSFLGVPLRANDILQDRVRECEYEHLAAMAESGRLKGLFFIHLKKDLAQEDIAWVGGPERKPTPQCNQTPYGIDRDIQRRLAEVRTDLDSFTQVEAYSLMLSGYQMAEEHAFALDRRFREKGGCGTWGGFDVSAPRGKWPFLKLAAIAAKPCDSSDLRRVDLEKQLAVGKERMLKAWRLSERLRFFGYGIILLLIFGLAYGVWYLWTHQGIEFTVSLWAVVAAIVGIMCSLLLPSWVVIDPERAWKEKLIRSCLAIFGWIGSNIHLWFIDPRFLTRGRVERLLRLPDDN